MRDVEVPLNNLYTTSIDKARTDNDIDVKLISDELTINFNNINIENNLLEIIDIHGRKVFSKVCNNNILNINTCNFSSGIYFVKLTYNNYNFTKRIVKY